MVEEFPSLEELGNTITDNSGFSSTFDLNGFPPVTETPPPGYMSEEGDTQDQGDVMGMSIMTHFHFLSTYSIAWIEGEIPEIVLEWGEKLSIQVSGTLVARVGYLWW